MRRCMSNSWVEEICKSSFLSEVLYVLWWKGYFVFQHFLYKNSKHLLKLRQHMNSIINRSATLFNHVWTFFQTILPWSIHTPLISANNCLTWVQVVQVHILIKLPNWGAVRGEEWGWRRGEGARAAHETLQTLAAGLSGNSSAPRSTIVRLTCGDVPRRIPERGPVLADPPGLLVPPGGQRQSSRCRRLPWGEDGLHDAPDRPGGACTGQARNRSEVYKENNKCGYLVWI